MLQFEVSLSAHPSKTVFHFTGADHLAKLVAAEVYNWITG